MNDVYYLKNASGHNVYKFVVTNNDGGLMGTCYKGDGWDSGYGFLCDVYCKQDSCTHWNFYGEDYTHGITEKPDSYYHLCGSWDFMEHIIGMCFIWKLAEQILEERYPNRVTDIHGCYYDNGWIEKMIEFVLYGYEIVKGE